MYLHAPFIYHTDSQIQFPSHIRVSNNCTWRITSFHIACKERQFDVVEIGLFYIVWSLIMGVARRKIYVRYVWMQIIRDFTIMVMWTFSVCNISTFRQYYKLWKWGKRGISILAYIMDWFLFLFRSNSFVFMPSFASVRSTFSPQ